MKKILLFLVAAAVCLAAHAMIETFELPPVMSWKQENKCEFSKNAAGKDVLTYGRMISPASYPAKYGECVVVTVRYSGKGSFGITLLGFDAAGKPTEKIYRPIYNHKGEQHSHSFSLDIANQETHKFRLEVESLRKMCPELSIESMVCRVVSGVENKLFSPVLNRDEWKKRTAGKNLALGKPIKFIPAPNYFLTKKGESDTFDLTDGKLSTKFRDYIWFDSQAVGWRDVKQEKQRVMLLDLEKTEPIDRLVIRICGGRLNAYSGRGMFPELLEVWISKNGVNYHKSSALKKLLISEREDSDEKTLYYLPEIQSDEAPCYVYPFQLDVNAEARYIALVATLEDPEGFFITDELAVIAGEKSKPGFNASYANAPDPLFLGKYALVSPFYPEFYVPTGIYLPNWFKFEDTRDIKNGSIEFTVDLPDKVSYAADELSWPAYVRKLVGVEKKDGRAVYRFKIDHEYAVVIPIIAQHGLGPFYFRADSDIPDSQKYVRFSTFVNGKQSASTRMKLNILNIPEVPPMKHLLLSATWFHQRICMYWPEFFQSARHVGFNCFGYHGALTEKGKTYLDDLKRHGFQVAAVPSGMRRFSEWMKKDKSLERFKCADSKKEKVPNQICPAYRGEYYDKLCQAVKDELKGIPADYIHFDEELWFKPDAFKTCTKCDALRKKKNMDWPQYAQWAMGDFLAGFVSAAREVQPKAKIGFYIVCADRKQKVEGKEIGIFGFDYLYPRLIDESHTGNYSSNPVKIHERARKNFLFTKDPKRVLCYLTAGAGAYYSEDFGSATKWELLEAFMNGSYAIAYYNARSFTSPRDYFYMAEGMKALAPYDEFLTQAGLDEKFKGDQPQLTYTLRVLGKKGLLLVGNYAMRGTAKVSLPLKGLKAARDCFSGKPVPVEKDGLVLEIDGLGGRLVELNFSEPRFTGFSNK